MKWWTGCVCKTRRSVIAAFLSETMAERPLSFLNCVTKSVIFTCRLFTQEAFFGKDLLDTSRQHKLSSDHLSEDAASLSYKANVNASFLDPSFDPLLSSSSAPAKPGTHGTWHPCHVTLIFLSVKLRHASSAS